MRGDVSQHWRYDAFLQHAEVRMESTYLNDLGTTRIRRALDAVRHPDTGAVVCRSVVDGSDPGCVPWNIFQTGGVTEEAAKICFRRLAHKMPVRVRLLKRQIG